MMRFDALRSRYANMLIRDEQVYPVSLYPKVMSSAPVVRFADEQESPQHALGDLGQAHLKRRLSEDTALTNGETVIWLSGDVSNFVVTTSRYFNMLETCDALRAELLSARDDTPVGSLPMRALAHHLAGDPLFSGAGRSAAVGVSVILSLPQGDPAEGERAFVIGHRNGSVSLDQGVWHVAPSGMLEPTGERNCVVNTVVQELAEELGIHLPVQEALKNMRTLGVVHDLTRLRPDLVVRLDLPSEYVPESLAPASEFDAVKLIPVTRNALNEFWPSFTPDHLTPACAGAVALLELSIDSS